MPPAEELYSQNLALKAKVEDLEAQLAWFRRQVFAGDPAPGEASPEGFGDVDAA